MKGFGYSWGPLPSNTSHALVGTLSVTLLPAVIVRMRVSSTLPAPASASRRSRGRPTKAVSFARIPRHSPRGAAPGCPRPSRCIRRTSSGPPSPKTHHQPERLARKPRHRTQARSTRDALTALDPPYGKADNPEKMGPPRHGGLATCEGTRYSFSVQHGTIRAMRHSAR